MTKSMNHFVRTLAISFLAACVPTFVVAQDNPQAAVLSLVKHFLAAEQAYDAQALAQLISNQYVEVSPAGEVDAHDRFLGFYTLDKKTEWPPMQTSEERVRIFGDTAIEILRFTYSMPAPGGGVRPLEIRGSFTAHRENGMWKLLGAQYTGIRPVPAAK